MQHEISKKEKLILKALGRVIRNMRKETKKSQRIFAFENDVQKSMISRFEACKNEPKLFSIWKISNAFGIKPSEFISLVEEELDEDINLIEM